MEFPRSFLRYHFVGKPVSGFFSGYKYVCCVCYPTLTGTACTQQFFSVFTFFVREEVKEMMNKRKTGSETLAAFEEHLNEVSFSNLRKQATFCNAFISSPAKKINDVWGWNFCACSSDIISWGNLWWHCKMLAVFFRTNFQWLQGLKKTWSS